MKECVCVYVCEYVCVCVCAIDSQVYAPGSGDYILCKTVQQYNAHYPFYLNSTFKSIFFCLPSPFYIHTVLSESFEGKLKAVLVHALSDESPMCLSLSLFLFWCHNTSLFLVVTDNRLQFCWFATSFMLKTMRPVKEKTVTWAIRWLGIANNLYFLCQ